MSKLPYTLSIKLPEEFPECLENLIEEPFCFLLDSAKHDNKQGRFSHFGLRPVKIFVSNGGMISVDNHTFIDNPVNALKKFERLLTRLEFDTYLPFHGGLVGFVGHNWPNGSAQRGRAEYHSIPDAWFGLYDTVLTYDHLEKSAWVTSFGLTGDGRLNASLAESRCEFIHEYLKSASRGEETTYKIKPLFPEPLSSFAEGDYVSAVAEAKNYLQKRDWQHTNLAQRYHAPVASDAWSIHKLLRDKNPTPYSAFLRCGNFELLSTSPSCFLELSGDNLKSQVVQKSAPVDPDPEKDHLNKEELVHSSREVDPIVWGDEIDFESICSEKPKVLPAHIESDRRSHFLVNEICGTKKMGCSTVDCLSHVMPGASMTGVPKPEVNQWLRKTEPASRLVYTGSIGYIGSKGNSQFNMAVRTMVAKDSVAYIHAGQQISMSTNAEETFYNTRKNIGRLFEDINSLGNNI